jgi:rhodanese-related sulfurtransferase
MGHVPDDAAAAPPDHLRTMETATRKGGAMALTLAQMVATARAEAREISPADAAEAHNRSALAMIVDVREPAEYGSEHIPGAINLPRGVIEISADPASPVADPALLAGRSGRILVYCTKGPGARSLLAAQTLTSMGYERVEVLGGGLIAWAEAGLPTETAAAPVA